MANRNLIRVVLLSACVVSLVSVQTAARAAVIGPEQFLSSVDRRALVDSVNEALARDEVQRALEHYGVDPAEATERVAALNDQELMLLADNLEDLPAGGSLLGLVGIVAIVVIILELVGVIDIFKKV